MPDEEMGQESTTEVVENSPQTETAVETEGGYNPAWEPLRQTLGLQFEAIKPELAKIDKDYHDHVTKVNGQYEPWKQFAEQGTTPDQVNQAVAILQKLNDSPEEIYQALGTFLEQNGRLPTPAEAAQAVDEQGDEDEYETEESKQLAAMQKRLDDFQALQQQQEQQRQQEQIQAHADQEVEKEYTAFQQAHPELDPSDWSEIQQRHLAYALRGPDQIRSLEDVGKEYFDLVNRIRSAPRPNDLAPRLPGAGGAAPAPQSKDPSSYSREESVDALAQALMAAKQN